MFVHNAQWIAFQAGSTSLKIKLSVSNCDRGDGLELGIYRSTDCSNFTLISNCRGATNAVSEGTSGEFETTEPLVIGQYYYLAMDGNRADNCDWTFEVLEGSTEIEPLTVTAPIEGEDRFCPGVIQTFTTEPEIGAVIFDWTLDGQIIGNNTNPSLDLSIEEPGIYQLCVKASNACDETEPVCKEIEIYTIPTTTIVDQFCEDDCYEIDGNSFCETGIFPYSITLENGCDSVIILDLIELEIPITNLDFNICEGDTIHIGTTPFFTAGSFSETISSNQLCDSTINLYLDVIICNIQSIYSTTSNKCFGDTNGMATFLITNGTAPFTYNWQHLQKGLQGTGAISNDGENITITNLPAGEIIVQIDDNFDNSDVLIIEIDQPPLIVIEALLSDYNGYNVTCNGFSDGDIKLTTKGGQEPYMYNWSSGHTSSIADNLAENIYIVTLTDNLGCESISEYTLVDPDMIIADVLFIDPNCSGLETGQIDIMTIEGGAPPYLYSINGSNFSDIDSFTQLGPNEYLVSIIDANMCEIESINELIAPQIPVITGDTDYTTQLGCEVQLDININDIDIQDIFWTEPNYLDCSDCFHPIALPLNSGLNMIIVSSIDDCTDTLTISIDVEKLRQFYVPNIFSPNGDGQNEAFGIYGGKEVEHIELHILDRWGNSIFNQLDMEPIDELKRWGGRFNGKNVESGVYLWWANICFIDGVCEVHSGDITLIR